MKSLILLTCLLATVFTQCPTFYTDYNRQGQSFQLCSSSDVPNGFNDQVSSFTVPKGYSVTLHADYGLSGEYWGPYSQGSYNVPTSFNDKLSSVSVFSSNSNNPKCPVFYADYSLQGDSFQQCNSGNVPQGWNDRISSFVIPKGYSIRLYADYNKRGQSRGPYSAGTFDVPAAFNDQTSYISITNYDDTDDDNNNYDGLDNYNCPTFYYGYNQRGSYFGVCYSGNIPARDNDKASSFVVPKDFTVYLYADNDFGGDYWGPYSAGYYNIPNGLANQLSSVIVKYKGVNDGKGGNPNNNGGYNRDNGRRGGNRDD